MNQVVVAVCKNVHEEDVTSDTTATHTNAPVPGGPYNKSPFGARRNPVNKSGRCNGQQTTSVTVCF